MRRTEPERQRIYDASFMLFDPIGESVAIDPT
jgi:hypothetical protein